LFQISYQQKENVITILTNMKCIFCRIQFIFIEVNFSYEKLRILSFLKLEEKIVLMKITKITIMKIRHIFKASMSKAIIRSKVNVFYSNTLIKQFEKLI